MSDRDQIKELINDEIDRLVMNLDIARANATGGRRSMTPEQHPRVQHAHGALEGIADLRTLLVAKGLIDA